jgi:hypothetical protein
VHELKETIVGHRRNEIDKKVDDALKNFEELKEQLAEEQEELRNIQRQEAITDNTNLHGHDALKVSDQSDHLRYRILRNSNPRLLLFNPPRP